jgi:hypothetical protein
VDTKIFLVATVVRREESKCYSVTAIKQCCILVLLHNAVCCGEKLLLLKLFVLGIKEPSSQLVVIALVTL